MAWVPLVARCEREAGGGRRQGRGVDSWAAVGCARERFYSVGGWYGFSLSGVFVFVEHEEPTQALFCLLFCLRRSLFFFTPRVHTREMRQFHDCSNLCSSILTSERKFALHQRGHILSFCFWYWWCVRVQVVFADALGRGGGEWAGGGGGVGARCLSLSFHPLAYTGPVRVTARTQHHTRREGMSNDTTHVSKVCFVP